MKRTDLSVSSGKSASLEPLEKNLGQMDGSQDC